MTEFYELFFQIEIKGAWYLSDVIDENGHEVLESRFCQGKYFDHVTNLTVIQNVIGKPVDFRETSFGVPIVSKAFADVVGKFDKKAVQRIPVMIAPSISGYEILNILTVLDCVDHKQSKIEYYTERDDPPKMVGHIKAIQNAHFNSDVVKGKHIFRLFEKLVKIIVSEDLKIELMKSKLTGMKFIPINKDVI
ncbi:MAG: hypothetical protein U0Z26_02830 [Anaerolineales bacterium]